MSHTSMQPKNNHDTKTKRSHVSPIVEIESFAGCAKCRWCCLGVVYLTAAERGNATLQAFQAMLSRLSFRREASNIVVEPLWKPSLFKWNCSLGMETGMKMVF